MKLFAYHLAIAFVAVFPCCSANAAEQADDPGSFQKSVAPLLARYCNDCHGADTAEADLALNKINPDMLHGDDLETWRIIEERVRFAEMPPSEADQPTAAQRTMLLDWIRAEMRKTQLPGVIADEKLLLPQFGNYVDHQSLFDERQPRVTPAAPRIWRLRPEIYNTIAPRLGERINGLANAMNLIEGPEFTDFAAPYFLDEASTQQLFANAKKIAANLTASHSKDRVFKQLMTDELPASELVESAIETAFRKALGRGPTADEKARYVTLHTEATRIADHKIAANAMLTAVLMQPEFVFRQELGDGQPDAFGRVRLTQRETAYALSYALAQLPVNEFVEAANSDQLKTNEQVAAIVQDRLTSDSNNFDENPRRLEFFREYFQYPYTNEVFKDKPAGGEHDSRALVADLEMTIAKILEEDEQVLRRLLTTREYYVNTKYGSKDKRFELQKRNEKTRKYQTAFSLPLDWKWGAHLQPVPFRADERAGVLTHPAWLSAWSGNFENHPVQRGKWVRTHLLGGYVPDVPIGVDARVPEIDHTTFRDRLKSATSAAECWRCHNKMDPLGVPFERYDHYGRVQRLDAGQPVDASGEISRTSFPELHRKVNGPTEMLDLLADSERVEQVFVRHAFRYFMGRNETLGDANTLQDAHQAYQANNGSFNALIVSLLSSDSFLLRTPSPAAE